MRRPIQSLAIVAVIALVTISTSEAALISFDLNAPDAALQGTTAPPCATVLTGLPARRAEEEMQPIGVSVIVAGSKV